MQDRAQNGVLRLHRVTVCDPSLTELLAVELDQAGSAASAELASALRDWMARPRPSLTATPVAGD